MTKNTVTSTTTSIRNSVSLINHFDNCIIAKLAQMEIARDRPGVINCNSDEYRGLNKEVEGLRINIHNNAVELATTLISSNTALAANAKLHDSIESIHKLDKKILAKLTEIENACDLVGDIKNSVLSRQLQQDLDSLRLNMHELAIELVAELPKQ